MTTSLIEMVEKRHVGDGWFVMRELGNATGFATARHADMVAFGIWPSHGYSVHGYELKESRADLIKELKDPSKADAVGKYCDHWWLVIRDAKMLEGLVIPKTWGVLVPKNTVLRVHTKAPKLKAKPVDAPFAAAIIRMVMKAWISRTDHMGIINELRAKAGAGATDDGTMWTIDEARRMLDRMRARITEFEERSGVQIDTFQGGHIGNAVKIVMELRNKIGENALRMQVNSIEGTARHYERLAEEHRNAGTQLRALLDGQYREQQELPLVSHAPAQATLEIAQDRRLPREDD